MAISKVPAQLAAIAPTSTNAIARQTIVPPPVRYAEIRRQERQALGLELSSRTAGNERATWRGDHLAAEDEAGLCLADQARVDWRDRSHFFGVASRIMRRVLVDHARARLAGKRGTGAEVLNLDWIEVDTGPEKLEEILSVDEALTRLREFDPQQARIIEMHYFTGMTVEETAQALGISSRTVDREWAMARAWLRRELSRKDSR